MRLTAAAAIVAVGALLAACGEKTIKADGAEKVVVDVVNSQTGFKPKDVECPSNVKAEVGETFQCTFTGPEGPYVADMRVREVEGERVLFDVRSRRSGN